MITVTETQIAPQGASLNTVVLALMHQAAQARACGANEAQIEAAFAESAA